MAIACLRGSKGTRGRSGGIVGSLLKSIGFSSIRCFSKSLIFNIAMLNLFLEGNLIVVDFPRFIPIQHSRVALWNSTYLCMDCNDKQVYCPIFRLIVVRRIAIEFHLIPIQLIAVIQLMICANSV